MCTRKGQACAIQAEPLLELLALFAARRRVSSHLRQGADSPHPAPFPQGWLEPQQPRREAPAGLGRTGPAGKGAGSGKPSLAPGALGVTLKEATALSYALISAVSSQTSESSLWGGSRGWDGPGRAHAAAATDPPPTLPGMSGQTRPVWADSGAAPGPAPRTCPAPRRKSRAPAPPPASPRAAMNRARRAPPPPGSATARANADAHTPQLRLSTASSRQPGGVVAVPDGNHPPLPASQTGRAGARQNRDTIGWGAGQRPAQPRVSRARPLSAGLLRRGNGLFVPLRLSGPCPGALSYVGGSWEAIYLAEPERYKPAPSDFLER